MWTNISFHTAESITLLLVYPKEWIIKQICLQFQYQYIFVAAVTENNTLDKVTQFQDNITAVQFCVQSNFYFSKSA